MSNIEKLGMQPTMTRAERIQKSLVGKSYWRFAVDVGFDLYFDDFVLSSQEVISRDETDIQSAFVDRYPPASFTANPDYIAKSAILAACLGLDILAVEVLDDSSLSLKFKNNVVIRLPTDTPVVDWHWAITESGGDPYTGCLAACFAPGDIQGSMSSNSFKPNPQQGDA